ncbi:MAG: hypothetical protein QM768_08875 [Agriterribacter sp.]
MKIIYSSLISLCSICQSDAQEKWKFHSAGMQYGISSIAKNVSSTGFVFSWEVLVRKSNHLIGAEYETATNMRIAGIKYAVDQVNLLYGRKLVHAPEFALNGFVGTGFYRQSFKAIITDNTYQSETAVGLKTKLSAQYFISKRLCVTVNTNITFNFSSTYFSLLAGFCYTF